jgi:hypothetical protein
VVRGLGIGNASFWQVLAPLRHRWLERSDRDEPRKVLAVLALGLLAGPGLLALGRAAAFVGGQAGIRHVGISPTILLAALALLLLGGIVVLVGRQRWVVLLPVLLAGISASVMIALLARGAGDWASGAPSLHLYSFPIALVGKVLSLAILHVTHHYHEDSLPWRARPGNRLTPLVDGQEAMAQAHE